MAKETKRCLIDGCERDAKTRGLCANCYAAAFREVKSEDNDLTWERLEALGLANSARRIRRKSAFMDALENANTDEDTDKKLPWTQ